MHIFIILALFCNFALDAAQVNFIPKLKAYTCKREKVIDNKRLLVTTTLIDNNSHWAIQRKDIYDIKQQGAVYLALWDKREHWNPSDANPEVMRLEKLLDKISEKIFQETKGDSIYLDSLEKCEDPAIQFDFNKSEISRGGDTPKENVVMHKLKKSCVLM